MEILKLIQMLKHFYFLKQIQKLRHFRFLRLIEKRMVTQMLTRMDLQTETQSGSLMLTPNMIQMPIQKLTEKQKAILSLIQKDWQTGSPTGFLKQTLMLTLKQILRLIH
jgi:hypothetical protein